MSASATRGEHERQVDVVPSHPQLYDDLGCDRGPFHRDHADNACEPLSGTRYLPL